MPTCSTTEVRGGRAKLQHTAGTAGTGQEVLSKGESANSEWREWEPGSGFFRQELRQSLPLSAHSTNSQKFTFLKAFHFT